MKSLILVVITLCLFSCHKMKENQLDNPDPDPECSEKIDYSSISSHPRLFMKSGEEESVKCYINNNSAIAKIHNHIISYCNTLLTQPPKECSGSGRGVTLARTTLKNVFWLSYAYRMTSEKRYAARAEDEMISICGYDNWAPEHYLDVAERLVAMAIGYDWLYPTLSASTRKLILENVIEKGFNPSYKSDYNNFFNLSTNWNPVCLAGLVTASVAMYEELPEMAQEIIEKSITSNLKSMREYGPDGGYPEGYTYWNYGTGCQIMLLEALEGAFGTTGGIESIEPAFFKSSKYAQFLTTPARNVFSYSDSETKAICSDMNLWFADKNNDPSLAYLEMRELRKGNLMFSFEDRHLPLLCIFASRLDLDHIIAPKENFWISNGASPIFVYRSGWESDNDVYLGVKAGKAAVNHGHMDAGSFFYEKDGINWAIDLGTFSYATATNNGINMSDYSQNGDRWNVFRTAAISHNTLTVNDSRHNVSGYTTFVETYKSDNKKGVQINMTPALNNELRGATRNVWLDNKNNLNVEDLLMTSSKPANIKWIMCTPAAAVILSKNRISLRYQSKEMILEVESPADVTCEVLSNEPMQPYDVKNPGTCRVCIAATILANCEGRIKVKLMDYVP